MAKKTTPLEKKGIFGNLPDKEKKQLTFLAMFLATLFSGFGMYLLFGTLDDIDKETKKYKSALELIAAQGPQYLEAKTSSKVKKSHKDTSEERIKNNDIKLTSFVAEIAERKNIKIGSYDESELPFGKNTEGPIIVEKQLTAKIASANMDEVIGLLDEIEKSNDPVFIKRIDIRKKGKKSNVVKATILVSTFVRKEPET